MTESKFTEENVRALIEEEIEPAEPQTKILAYLKEREGKQLTKRDETKLQAIHSTARISKRYGMTNIEWGGGYGSENGGSLLIAHTEGSPTIDAAAIEQRNTAYFSAREERNALRAQALQSQELIKELVNALNAKIAAEAKLHELFGYKEPLSTVESSVKRVMKSFTFRRSWP